MNDKTPGRLLRVFLASYEQFRVRLRRRLGSDDLAGDVLHETYLRVGRMDEPEDLQRPDAYLYRMALNVAADRRAQDARLLTGAEVQVLLESVEEPRDPAAIVGGQGLHGGGRAFLGQGRADHHRCGVLCHQLFQEGDAVHAWHLHVQHDHIRPVAVHPLQGEERVGGCADHLDAVVAGQAAGQYLSHDCGVVDDHHLDLVHGEQAS